MAGAVQTRAACALLSEMLHARAMVKSGGAFQVGDRAVYPAHGVAEVVAIESKDIAGSRKDFYVLKVIHSEMKLMIPCDGADRAGLRVVATAEIAAEVFAVLASGEIAVKPGPWNRRFREYSELVNSGRLVEVAKVYRDLWRIRPTRELSYGERRLLDHSRNLLVAELSLARNVTPAELEVELETAVLPAAVVDTGVPDAGV